MSPHHIRASALQTAKVPLPRPTGLSGRGRLGGEVVLEARDLVAHYGDRRILDGVSLTVHRGEIAMIVGSSGCGKTTLLKHLIGLLKPTDGSILYWGREIGEGDAEGFAAVLERIGVSFQSGGLFNSLTLAQNVALPLRELRHLDDRTIDEVVDMKLEMVGLAHAKHLLPAELSGGMKKRAGFARALALDPEIVFIDEPSSGLDPIIAAGLDELIRKLAFSLDLTMVIVTHELPSIKLVADRVLMLDAGRAIFEGALDDALRSEHPRVAQFFRRQADATISKGSP